MATSAALSGACDQARALTSCFHLKNFAAPTRCWFQKPKMRVIFAVPWMGRHGGTTDDEATPEKTKMVVLEKKKRNICCANLTLIWQNHFASNKW